MLCRKCPCDPAYPAKSDKSRSPEEHQDGIPGKMLEPVDSPKSPQIAGKSDDFENRAPPLLKPEISEPEQRQKTQSFRFVITFLISVFRYFHSRHLRIPERLNDFSRHRRFILSGEIVQGCREDDCETALPGLGNDPV